MGDGEDALGVGEAALAEGGEVGGLVGGGVVGGGGVGGAALQMGRLRGKQNAHRQGVGGRVGATARGVGLFPRTGRGVGEGVIVFETGTGVGSGVGKGVGNGVGRGVGSGVGRPVTALIGCGVGNGVGSAVLRMVGWGVGWGVGPTHTPEYWQMKSKYEVIRVYTP